MDHYQLLANAIVEQAAIDYFNLLAGFPPLPDTGSVIPTKREIEKFFHCNLFGLLTDINAEYLITKIKEKANSMILVYTVKKEKGSTRYYVCKVGDHTPLTRTYSTKKKALHKAAEMQDLDYKTYMKIRRRDGVDYVED